MAELIKPKGRSFDETRSLVRSAVQALYPSIGTPGTYAWIDEIFDGEVIYSVESGNKTDRYHSVYAIDKDGKVTLGEPINVVKKPVWQKVDFTVEFSDPAFSAGADGVIRKDAKLFTCGDYPDKGFALTQSEADTLVLPNLAGLPIKAQHVNTVFDPGAIEKAWRVGDDIYGTLAFNSWVGEALKGKAPDISMGFDKVTKLPKESSLVIKGRIDGAALLAAFEGSTATPVERKGLAMSFFATLAEKLGIRREEVETGIKAEFSEATKPMLKQIEQLEAENKALKQGQANFAATAAATTAESLTQGFVVRGKIAPAEAESVKTVFQTLLAADGASVSFSADGKPVYGAGVTSFIASLEARPVLPHFAASGVFEVPAAGGAEKPKPATATEVYEARKSGGKK